jgi:hypothetical protein
MARVNFKPVKPEKLKRPREASVFAFSTSLSDHAYRQKIDPRRRPEVADSEMIMEDHNAIANLPMTEINAQWTPGRFMPHYWMESEIRPVGTIRFNEAEDE